MPRAALLGRHGAAAMIAAFAMHVAAAGAQPISRPAVTLRRLAAPSTVSAALAELIDGPTSSTWNLVPQTPAEWRGYVAQFGAGAAIDIADLERRLHVSVRPAVMGGVSAFIVEPEVVAAANRRRWLVNLHGAAYAFLPGRACVREAVLMAALAKIRVIAIDYRTPPDHPYPAALDDAQAAWTAIARTHDPRRLGLFGNSAGGGLALALVERLHARRLPTPAAIWAGTPWTDLAKRGDSYVVNEGVDRVLVSYDGLLGAAARLYAGHHSFDEPGLSPIYGDVRGFPPTLLTTGTRDLFLSNTARFNHKLRLAGVETVMDVLEGQSHDDYERLPDAPETRELYAEISTFFARHLHR